MSGAFLVLLEGDGLWCFRGASGVVRFFRVSYLVACGEGECCGGCGVTDRSGAVI